MSDKKPFLYWLFVLCCIATSSVFAYHLGFWGMVEDKDDTKISWLICAITAASSMVVGWLAYDGVRRPAVLGRLWFVSDAMVTLGMIGTVAGFLMMMGDSFTQIDPGDQASMQRTMQDVGAGMGTILVTTLMGLIASVLLKLQLVIVDHEG